MPYIHRQIHHHRTWDYIRILSTTSTTTMTTTKTQNSGDSGVVGDENKRGTRYYITMWHLSHARMNIITVNDVCW